MARRAIRTAIAVSLALGTVPLSAERAALAQGRAPAPPSEHQGAAGEPQQADATRYVSQQAVEQARRDAEAHALFSAGANALADGRFEEALERFQRAYDLSGRPEVLYNIGLAHDRLRHDTDAAAAFDAYLKLSPDPTRRADAQARLKVLRSEAAPASGATGARQLSSRSAPPGARAEQGLAAKRGNDSKAPASAAAPSAKRKLASDRTLEPPSNASLDETAAAKAKPAGSAAQASAPASRAEPRANTREPTKPPATRTRTVIAAPALDAPIPESPLLKGI
jgi:tetratricopeptide (TPR) repeat protein